MSASVPFPRDSADETRVPIESLRQFVTQILVKKSVFQFDAQMVADRLIEADARGIQSHGCRLLPGYLDALDAGDIDPRGRVLVEHETPAIAVLDGSRALGHVAATKAMRMAVEKAKGAGTGTVVVHHSQHLGAASVYSLFAAREGLIGVCSSSTGRATVAAAGSTRPFVSNHPIAYAFPTAEEEPLVIDFSCGALSWGKVEALAAYGLPLPEGTVLDEIGRPTTDPAAARCILPAGGPRGFGLGLALSLLTSGLSGGKLPYRKTRSAYSECSEHWMMAIDVGQFTDVDKFRATVSEARTALRALEPGDEGPVRAPGDRAAEEARRCSVEGIALHRSDIEALSQRAQALKVEVPW
jgi:LDH2 family malate/lactate/ureidoglycolate dehydrogenase